MNCEHETLVGDNDLFQMLIGEYKLSCATDGACYIYLLEEHLEEYLPRMNAIYAMQVINFLLGEIKQNNIKLETTGMGDFFYLSYVDKWNSIKDFLIKQKDHIMMQKDN